MTIEDIVTSPGSLYFGLTLEEAMSGRSKQRNRVLAEVFNQMGLIEAWGTGLKKFLVRLKNIIFRNRNLLEWQVLFG